jgi:hypothetical protein
MFLSSREGPSFTPIKTTGKIMFESKIYTHFMAPDIRTAYALTDAFQMGGQSEANILVPSQSHSADMHADYFILCESSVYLQVFSCN